MSPVCLISCLLLVSVTLVFEAWLWLEFGEQEMVKVTAPIQVKAISPVLINFVGMKLNKSLNYLNNPS
jgi:hypothetical protein